MDKQPFILKGHIEILRKLISLNIHPYNLGDMGETETSIERLIKYAEAHESRHSPTDAVAFAEFAHEEYEYLIVGAGEVRWRKKGIDRPKGDNGKLYTTPGLYALFNLSRSSSVNPDKMVKALEQVVDYVNGRYGKKYTGVLVADCIAALDDYY